MSALVQFFGRRHAETIPTLGQPASENLYKSRPYHAAGARIDVAAEILVSALPERAV
jgi:hypothetical protein